MQLVSNDMDFVGIPATVLSWLSIFEVVKMSPMLDLIVSIFSIVWLSIQIFGWIEKRIKLKKNASK
jgi:hypothetical protein